VIQDILSSAGCGGYWNKITTSSDFGTIAGGDTNRVEKKWGTVGGGELNVVTSNGEHATIPGGRENIAQSYGQTVVGVFNRAVGSSVASDFNTQPIPLPRGDDPLFIVGNGKSSSRSNAFEVSNNGHSTTYDVNGESVNVDGTAMLPPLPREVYYGSTYVDNVVYAWGDVSPNVGGLGNQVTVNGSFGVKEIIRNGAGDYTIKLFTADITGNPSNLTKASITANIVQSYDDTVSVCGFIFPSEIVQVGAVSQFKIRITYRDCTKEDRRFMFKVCGRP
jgi:hypothetical protein